MPVLYEYKRRLCNHRAEKRAKGQKMDMHNHVRLTHNPVCYMFGCWRSFFYNGQTKSGGKEYACQNAYESRLIKKDPDTVRKKNNSASVKFGYTESSFYTLSKYLQRI